MKERTTERAAEGCSDSESEQTRTNATNKMRKY